MSEQFLTTIYSDIMDMQSELEIINEQDGVRELLGGKINIISMAMKNLGDHIERYVHIQKTYKMKSR